MNLLRKCISCEQYTMESNCPKCSSKTVSAYPPKYSIEDKYALYRRKERFKESD